MLKKVVVLWACVGLFSGIPALANQIIVGTEANLNVTGGYGLGQYQYIAQSFTLPVVANVGSIDIVLGVTGSSTGSTTVRMFLSSTIGNETTTSDVLATADIVVQPHPIIDYQAGYTLGYGQHISMNVDRLLAPGTYYLVASVPDGIIPSAGLFWPQGYRLPDTIGSITNKMFWTPTCYDTTCVGQDVLFPPASVWSTAQSDPPVQFVVYESNASVPEPTTSILFASGLLGLKWVNRARRR